MDTVIDRIVRAIRCHRYIFSTEMELQAGIERALMDEGIVAEREVLLSPTDRIDFMVGRVGIEVKIGGTYSALVRQIQRYAHVGQLCAIVVVTTKSRLRALPAEIASVPVYTIHLNSGL